MAPPPQELRRAYKRPAISDQQRRRELALLRQSQHRADSHHRARQLASSLLPTSPSTSEDPLRTETEIEPEVEPGIEPEARVLDATRAAKLGGAEARRWFARQIMLPEWMVDAPPDLDRDWELKLKKHFRCGTKCFFTLQSSRRVFGN